MTTADLCDKLDAIAERHPEERDEVAAVKSEIRERSKITLAVENALHEVLKNLEQ